MMYKTLLLEEKQGYSIVTLHRPEEMNAISLQMRADLYACFTQLEADREVHAIILTGGDYVFSSGLDLKEMSSLAPEEIRDFFSDVTQYQRRIYGCKKPIIGVVGGIALGGGFNLVTFCDLIIASESAIFGHPELTFGINPLFNPLRQIVGTAKAKEITMLGQPIGAKEALRIGLVNKVLPPEKLLPEAEKIAQEMAAKSPEALEAVKKLSDIAPRLDKISALDLEVDIEARLFAGEERKKRMDEFMQSLKNRKKE